MWMRFLLGVPAFVFALVLLVLIISFGAVFTIRFRKGRPGFSYFADATLREQTQGGERK